MNDILTTVNEWLQRHDIALDLITVWVLSVVCTGMGLGKLATWLMLRHTHDDGMVGTSLKHNKFTETLFWGALAAFFWITLAIYYFALRPEPYQGAVLLLALVVTGTLALLLLARFTYYLWRGEWRGKETRDERDDRQTATDIRQNIRDAGQDATERRHQDWRGETPP